MKTPAGGMWRDYHGYDVPSSGFACSSTGTAEIAKDWVQYCSEELMQDEAAMPLSTNRKDNKECELIKQAGKVDKQM